MSNKQSWKIKLSAFLAVSVIGISLVSLLVLRELYLHLENAERQQWKERHTKAAERLHEAWTDSERFYPLTELAKSAFYLGLTNEARSCAQRLLIVAPQFRESWNYGNAIHDGNMVLGRIAVQEGKIKEAKQFLIEAGKSPGSPQLDSFGPDMGLAQDLLERGERETVLEYLGLCGNFWRMHHGRLEQWSRAIKAGKIPDLQNVYD